MKRYLTFAVVGSSLFIWAIDSTVVAVAFPVFTADFGVSLVVSGLVLSVYQVVSLCAMPVAARLSDSFGRKVTFISCLVLFTAGSALCALSSNITWLIVFRAIQGLGGGGFMPSAAGIVAEAFPDKRQSAVGLFSGIFPFGAVIGPSLGGILIKYLSWHWVFWVNVPLGVVGLLAARWLIRPDSGRGKLSLDLAGSGLMATCIFAFMLALSLMDNKTSVPWLLVGLSVLAFVAAFWLFIRWERRVDKPIIDLKLLAARPFREANLFQFLFGAFTMGISALIPLYASSVYGMSTFTSGIVLTPRSIGQMAASTISAFMLMRWGYRRPILTGTMMVLCSLVLLALESPGFDLLGLRITPLTIILLVMLLNGTGMGIAAPAANNACIDIMPEKVAMITGLRGMFRQMGGAVCITVVTLILQIVGDISRGFVFVLAGLVVVGVASLPLIFIMPASPAFRVVEAEKPAAVPVRR